MNLKELWYGKPVKADPAVKAAWDAMMKRQGFDSPETLQNHIRRLEERIAELERKAADADA